MTTSYDMDGMETNNQNVKKMINPLPFFEKDSNRKYKEITITKENA